MDPAGALSTREYDTFGRLAAVYAPSPDGIGTQLALRLTHTEKNPLSYVKVERRATVDTFVTSLEIFNGIGEHVLGYDQADPAADGAPWVQRSWSERYASGQSRALVDLRRTPGSPFTVADTAPVLSPAASRYSVERDAFGRAMLVYDGALVTAEYRHRPLETDVIDAEQRNTASDHYGLITTSKTDGHGRPDKTEVHYRDGAGIERVTTTQIEYLATGEPRKVVRSDTSSASTYVRTLYWDSFGRLVANDEPNTSVGVGNDHHEWRYVYDDANRLVGTSDARGCGVNLFHDALGRVVAEDYSPCTAEQSAYTSPNLVAGDGTEVFYRYDQYEAGQVAPTPEFADAEEYALGRLVSVRDCGSHTRFNFDARGLVRRVSRRAARPGEPSGIVTARYTPRWYEEATDFDLGDRIRARRTKLESTALLVNGKSEETFAYSQRGLPRTLVSSYGTLASDLRYEPNGALNYMVYGDAASTKLEIGRDSRDRIQQHHLHRTAPPPVWSQRPNATWTTPGADTTQLDLADHGSTTTKSETRRRSPITRPRRGRTAPSPCRATSRMTIATAFVTPSTIATTTCRCRRTKPSTRPAIDVPYRT